MGGLEVVPRQLTCSGEPKKRPTLKIPLERTLNAHSPQRRPFVHIRKKRERLSGGRIGPADSLLRGASIIACSESFYSAARTSGEQGRRLSGESSAAA